VHVGGGDEHDMSRILERNGGEDERGEEGEHRQAIWGIEGWDVILRAAATAAERPHLAHIRLAIYMFPGI
jgi:hypothetical protein